jgi:histidinol dehydrogenase
MRILSGRAAERRVRDISQRQTNLTSVQRRVQRIVQAVRTRGDVALRTYARRWDGLGPKQPLQVPTANIEAAWTMADPRFRAALREAATNIRAFATRQKPRSWTYTRRGISLGQTIRPIESVGCYVPAGRHPLVSTVLMTVIPAQVAGV